MKVSELIKKLEKISGGCDVVLSRDAEGNGYAFVHAADVVWFLDEGHGRAEDIYDCEVGSGLPPEGAHKVLCLWPV